MAVQAGRRREQRPVHGLLLLNKPAGITSNRALQAVRRLLRARKAGHTGSLDPAATGMLPLCFGEATKVSAWLLDADKCYRVVARLGIATDTGDADGEPVATAEVPALAEADWLALFERFTGEIEQVPPMYSALKQGGKRLYELAREGRTVERKPRRVAIRRLELLEAHGSRLVFRVACSKGTYVRTLVEDLARAAGGIAHTAALHRESVAGFAEEEMLTLAALEAEASAGGAEALDRHLLPVDRALGHWPACRLVQDAASRFLQGQPVTAADADAAAGSLLRAYDEAGRFLGVASATGDGRVAPKRLFGGLPGPA